MREKIHHNIHNGDFTICPYCHGQGQTEKCVYPQISTSSFYDSCDTSLATSWTTQLETCSHCNGKGILIIKLEAM